MLAIGLMMLEKQEDKDKLMLIYKKYQKLMLKIAFSVLNDFELSKDIVHDSIIKIAKIISSFEDIESIKTKNTIVIITKNTAINEKNKMHKHLLLNIDEINKNAISNTSVENEALNNIMFETIASSIEKLDYKYSDILQLKFEADLSDKQISEILGISNDLCRKRLQTARSLLIKLLKQGGIFDEITF